jgi:hypothetical protein
MSKKFVVLPICLSLVLVSLIFTQRLYAASVETVGDLKVNGTVESTGGFKFSDGTTLSGAGDITASSGSAAFTVTQQGSGHGIDVTSQTGDAINISAQNNGIFSYSAHANGVHGFAAQDDASYAGVFGSSHNSACGVYGQSTSDGHGVRGESSNGDAIHGESGGTGVYGASTGSVGVLGYTTASGSTNAGVKGLSGGTASGVYGQNTGGGYGVYGVSDTGVAGFFQITNASNTTNALFAQTYGNGDSFFSRARGIGTAIVGSATGTGRAGAFTIDNVANGSDALFVSTNGLGKAGAFQITNDANSSDGLNVQTNGSGTALFSHTSGAGAAIIGDTTGTGRAGAFTINNASSTADCLYASTNGSGHAGYFSGKVHVAGQLSKSSGSFKIDHPLDPANKYLYHSFVESPDMKNIYDGIVTTDAQGYATVQLPAWFEALNRDFRYQLTVIDEADGAEFVLAKVVRGVKDNSFTIRASKPETKVSWQVTGIRQDAWANAHRIPVEEEKTGKEAGTYLNPELFGQPETMRAK